MTLRTRNKMFRPVILVFLLLAYFLSPAAGDYSVSSVEGEFKVVLNTRDKMQDIRVNLYLVCDVRDGEGARGTLNLGGLPVSFLTVLDEEGKKIPFTFDEKKDNLLTWNFDGGAGEQTIHIRFTQERALFGNAAENYFLMEWLKMPGVPVADVVYRFEIPEENLTLVECTTSDYEMESGADGRYLEVQSEGLPAEGFGVRFTPGIVINEPVTFKRFLSKYKGGLLFFALFFLGAVAVFLVRKKLGIATGKRATRPGRGDEIKVIPPYRGD